MITQGDYSEFVDRQVQHLLDDNPDAQAIVFANDDMAFSGYRVYEKRGHKVGKDLYEAKNTTRALSVELKMVARSATISDCRQSPAFAGFCLQSENPAMRDSFSITGDILLIYLIFNNIISCARRDSINTIS